MNTWVSHAIAVRANAAWAGDCDDLASTVLNLCYLDGASRDSRYFLEVWANPGDGSKVGHAIGAMTDDTGKFWIVGDTFFPAPYPVEQMQHVPIQYHHQSEDISIWRAGVPWTIEKEST